MSMMFVARKLPLLKKLLKFYCAFALLNVSYKIFSLAIKLVRVKRLWKNVPGGDVDPSGKTIMKNVTRIHDFLTELMEKTPSAPLIKLPTPVPFMLCNSAESIQWMLKDEFANITKPAGQDFLFEMMREFLGKDGIFVLRHGSQHDAENSTWHKERKVSSLIFTKANFENIMYDTFVEKAKLFVARVEKSVDQNIDMQELFFSYTMDSIEKFFMGTEVDTVSGGMSEYAKSFDLAHQAMVRVVNFGLPIDIINRIFLPFPFGTLRTDDASSGTLFYRLHRAFNQDYQTFKFHVNKLGEHINGYIRKTRADTNIKQRKDIIANFLNSSIGEEMTDKMLRDIVLNLTIAGRDTTACALSWLFFELSQNPEAQQKLIEEVREKLGGRVPTLADIEPSNMPYLQGALYEALRLHPSVPTDQKIAEKDLTYLDGTIIPAGTSLFFSPYAHGRNPTIYENPKKFDPTRWIPFKQPSLYEFPVFQAGPRFCLGKDMAQFEAKILTSMILQKFSFTLKEGEVEKISYSMMLTASVANNEDKSSFKLWMKPHKI